MSELWIHGAGVVSPAGWGLAAFREAVERGEPLAPQELERPGWARRLRVRRVPPPAARTTFAGHARLRRASPISQYAVGAALEALGNDAALVQAGRLRLGIILCVMSGCVNYSRRFYDETLRDPSTASPLVFPETVFNAPASHLGALLGAKAINYTLVGDPGSFPLSLVIAAGWLEQDLVDGCVIVGAEELDWLTADAFRLFTRRMVVSDGAGALYVRGVSGPSSVQLGAVSDARLFTNQSERSAAISAAAAEAQAWAATPDAVVCDGCQDLPWLDRAEGAAWRAWAGARISPRRVLGEGLMAAAAWQCVAAVDCVARGVHPRALVPLSGINEHCMWTGFTRAD